jgi:hypothetical protein
MATSANVMLRNDITLRSVGLLLLDIHDRAPDWDQRPEDERADFWLEWEAIVDRLHGVIEDDRDGLLTLEQQQKLRELARRLVEARGVIQRIDLPYPDLGHLLAEMPLTADERIAHDLWSLHSDAGRLRSLAELGNSPFVSSRERQAFPGEWSEAVDLFGRLAALAARGALRPEARSELRSVAEELTELLPTMQRLRLRQPDPDVLERARSIEAA